MNAQRRRRGEASGIVIIVVAVLVIAGLGAWKIAASNQGGDGHGPWLHSIDEGSAEAGALGRPMLVLFTADWCPPCRALKRDVLTRSDVLEYLESEWTLVKVDLTEPGGPGSMEAQQMGVQAIPTMIAFDSDGYQLEVYGGNRTAEDFVAWARRLAR